MSQLCGDEGGETRDMKEREGEIQIGMWRGRRAGGSTGAVRDGESAGLRGTEVGTDGTERKTGRRRKRNYAGTKIRS